MGDQAVTVTPARSSGLRLRRHLRVLTPSLGAVPFFAYVTIFLIVPTVTVAVGASGANGHFTLANVEAWKESALLTVLWTSVRVSAASAILGAVFGSLLAYAVVTAKPDGLVRRAVTSASAVLAQFGGVSLAFAFIATVGQTGVVTVWAADHLHIDLFGSGWLYQASGLILVYTYFQIPLMVIVFLPALEGLRPQWREAADNLGASNWQYWRHVAMPLLTPGAQLPSSQAALMLPGTRVRVLVDDRPVL
ncbi:MAG: ABC transporter permease, partial [Nocardioidaceae bacterium]